MTVENCITLADKFISRRKITDEDLKQEIYMIALDNRDLANEQILRKFNRAIKATEPEITVVNIDDYELAYRIDGRWAGVKDIIMEQIEECLDETEKGFIVDIYFNRIPFRVVKRKYNLCYPKAVEFRNSILDKLLLNSSIRELRGILF